ncbi:2-C-methyl-D-erythritol 4-phosphate cytidylyltransferase [Parafilimonas sp.]|uniref:2-C-methyl-D-erythritol 4-phosphate cytidylyltransferase n=1 Tax=Parafilimonas sp. TaxID=1969739 RepID=UPI0039E47E3E
MKKYAVIVAGGSGKRMGNIIPKQFLPLKGKAVLWYTLDTFLRAYNNLCIILVLPEQHIQKGKAIIDSFADKQRINIVAGGDTRFHSVQCGLTQVKEESVVFVHDAVRCLVSVPLIQRCYKNAVEYGSAVPAVAATDSIRIINHTYHTVAKREDVRIIQTPQTFLSSIILPAFEQEYSDSFTDEATVVEAYGAEVCLTEGEYDNIKITRPVDMMIAERILEERSALKFV